MVNVILVMMDSSAGSPTRTGSRLQYHGPDTLHYRLATLADIPRLHALIDRSVRELQARDYTPAQLDGALGSYLGVDTQLIADGTYFVVEAPDANPEASFIASGGWSRRKTLCGGDRRPGRDDSPLDPATEA